MRLREQSGQTDPTLRLPAVHIPRLQTALQTWASRGPAHVRADALVTVWRWLWTVRWFVLAWCASAIVAALAVHLLLDSVIVKKVAAFLYAFNFDQERVLLMTTLLMVLAGCATAGVLVRRRMPVVVGGLLYFGGGYLRPFLLRAQQPPPGPAGIKQVLIPGALTSLGLTVLAIALVCASVGAAVGAAYGELVVTPLLGLVVRLWVAVRQPGRAAGRAARQAVLRALPRTALALALGGLLAYSLVLSGAVPGTLLTYGIEGTLYRLAPGARGGGASVEAHGTVLQGTYSSPSLNGISRTYAIYLPPSYTVATAERYPVLYLLHGSPGSPNDWMTAGKAPMTADALLALGKIRETIIVGANGNGPVYLSQWANSFDRRQRMEDAIAFDLVQYIDQHYRTLPDAADRAIGGNSEGGYGAVNIALHHPEIFSTAVSMAGYFVAEGVTFGYGAGSKAYRAYNSPSQYIYTSGGAHAAHAVQFVICAGTKDGEYYSDSQDFYQRLVRLGVRVTFEKNSGGHGWGLWALQLGEALPLLEPPIQAQETHP